MSPDPKPVEPQQPDKTGEPKVDQDDAQIEEPEDDAFDEDRDDTSNVSE